MEIVIYKKLEVSASGTDSDEFVPLYRKLTLKEIRLVADSAVTAHASNHVVLKFIKGSTTLASRDFSTGSGSSMSAGVAEALSLSGGADLDFSDLDELKITYDQSNSGMAFDGGALFVFEPRREV